MPFNSVLSNKLTLSLLILFFSPFTLAATGHFYLGGMLGASLANNANQNPSITYYQNFLTDTYHFNTELMLGLNGGYEFSNPGLPAIALGLGIYDTPSQYHFKGQLIETAQGGPSITLYDFQYHIQSARLIVEA